MVKVKGIIVATLFFAVFSIALINFGIILASQNNPNQSIGNSSLLSNYAGNLTASIGAANSNSSGAYNSFSNSSISTTGSIPFITAIGGIWKSLISTPVAIWNLTIPILQNLLGPNAALILISIVATILVVSIIVAVVYWTSRGEGGN